MPTASLVNRHALLALFTLVLQNTALVICLKLSFRPGASPYAPATAVLVTEILKLLLCGAVVTRQSLGLLRECVIQIRLQKSLLIPAILYVIQSNLLFYASERLSPVVFISCTQLKVLTTAVVSRTFLGTKVTIKQYSSLIFLVVGIVLVQDPGGKVSNTQLQRSTSISGLFAVLLSAWTSAAAGVLLEKIYKDPGSLSFEHTIWTRNVQLSLISIPFAIFGVYSQAPLAVLQLNLFQGYDIIVWIVIFLQAAGGIIIAYVLKFATTILKCLAISISICCCAIYSVAWEDMPLKSELVAGIITVNVSVTLFALQQPNGLRFKRQKKQNQVTNYDEEFGQH